MVQPTGLEPVTSSFAGKRSNPTELRLRKKARELLFWQFLKMERGIGFVLPHTSCAARDGPGRKPNRWLSKISSRFYPLFEPWLQAILSCEWEITILLTLQKMERGIGFEPTHPRVEALVHSLSYVTPAKWWIDTLSTPSEPYSMKKPCKVKVFSV